MICAKRIILCFSSILFFVQPLVADGFLTGTLVKNATGSLPIEQLQVNDKVFCFDLVNRYTTHPVIHITTGIIDHYVRLCIDDTYLNIAPDQLLYLPKEERWIKAEQLTTNHVLLAYDMQLVPIDSIEQISITAKIYKVTVSKYHNVCVSPQGITAHNFFPLIGAGVWLTFGAGAVQWGMGLVAGIGMLGSVLGLTLSKNSDDRKGGFTITPTANEGDSVNICSPSGFPGGPNKRKSDKAENMYEVFKNHPVGETLKRCAEKTRHNVQGQTVWQAVKDMIEYGIKESDYFYLDNLHKDHIEVFKSTGKMLLRTVLNLDGSINAEKVARAAARSIRQYIK